ncbi:MAG: hypothetical protein KAR42_13815 [candidate division Zixibacteria bacterium]|nr:hypothetical protein [candidate division Zixibacteria bacterium]
MRKFTLSLIIILGLLFPQYLLADNSQPDSTKAVDSTKTQPEYELIPLHTKPVSATQYYEIKKNKFGIWINNNLWIKAELGLNRESKIEFEHIGGEVQALLLYKDHKVSPEEFYETILLNAKKVSRDSKVVFNETRLVNGHEILCMRIDGTIDYVPFSYYGYYYTGFIGTIQLITIISPDLFEEYEYELTDFLDGLLINK